ncbi:MAG TPA: TonB-dependent receptor [Proteobacteria bacterium]|nr:TonB-dependent receptor [Pseudomonadota bacterium]
MYYLCLLAVMLTVLSPAKLVIAEETKDTVAIKEIIVTATKTPQEIENVPGSVSVVTKEDISKRNIQVLDQALRELSGIFVRRGKGLMDTLAHVSLRGLPGKQRTAILLDGLPLNDSYTNTVEWAGLPMESVEQIEVVRGPVSALYGGNAMGGVVNIITRMPEKQEVLVKAGYGTDQTWSTRLGYGNKVLDKISFRLGAEYLDTDGYPANLVTKTTSAGVGTPVTGWTKTTTSTGSTTYIVGNTGDNTWSQGNFDARVALDLPKASKLTLGYVRQQRAYDYDRYESYLRDASGNPVISGSVTFDNPAQKASLSESNFLNGKGKSATDIYTLRIETQPADRCSLKLNAGLTDRNKNWYTKPNSSATWDSGTGKVSESPSKAYQAEIQSDFMVAPGNILTAGISYRQGESTSEEYDLSFWKDENSKIGLNYRSEGKDRTYALFAQDEWHLPKNLTLFLGLRYDYWKTYDGSYDTDGSGATAAVNYPDRTDESLSPKISILYKPREMTTLRLSGGTAFRSPNVYNLYRTWVSTTGWTYRGNPNLEPETTASWEVGWEQKTSFGTRFKATYFENYVQDLIYLVTDTSLSKTKTYQNAAKAKVKGVELELRQKINPFLEAFATLTYNDAVITEYPSNPTIEGKQLTYVPKNMYSVGLDFAYRMFKGSLVGRYVGKIYSNDDNTDSFRYVYGSYDPYFVVDAKVSANVTKNIELSLSADNLFDQDYYYYYEAPGTAWFAEMAVRF